MTKTFFAAKNAFFRIFKCCKSSENVKNGFFYHIIRFLYSFYPFGRIQRTSDDFTPQWVPAAQQRMIKQPSRSSLFSWLRRENKTVAAALSDPYCTIHSSRRSRCQSLSLCLSSCNSRRQHSLQLLRQARNSAPSEGEARQELQPPLCW